VADIKQQILNSGKISAEVYQQALELVASKKLSLLHALETLNVLDEASLLSLFAEFYQLPRIELDKVSIPKEIIELIPKALCLRYRVIPIERAGNNIIIATGDPGNLQTIDAIRFKVGYFPKPVLASEFKISAALNHYFGKMSISDLSEKDIETVSPQKKAARTDISDTLQGKDDGPVIKLVNDIILQCIEKNASDIHLESYEDSMRVRLRIDGSLHEIVQPPLSLKGALISRIKIMSGLNIAETRLPQDGAINIKIGDKPVDFRINSVPTSYGEKIVMRVLDKENLQVDMTKLGFEPAQLEKFTKAIHSPNGIILVTGPTGSGKTTTLYSALQDLNDEESNIMTAEDPVEYNLRGINQIQMKAEIGLDFSTALRAFLRQDPDVIMLGEVRDLETAEISIKAALTGHVVLSTLHTNSAVETIGRLLNMGVAAYNLVAALKCVTAQRLMKTICTRCREIDAQVAPEVLIGLGVHPGAVNKVRVYRGKGCPVCNGTGTKGRIAVHEVLLLDEEIRQAILSGASVFNLKKIAMAGGMHSLRQAALLKMARGLIPLSEVISETSSDSE
jgi:type IV pilus assembly protein PilB